MDVTACCPVLLSVQLIVAAVGVTVGVVVVQPLNDKAAGWVADRLTNDVAALPVLGVAVKLPRLVPLVAVTVT
jgi:hypothetical protein